MEIVKLHTRMDFAVIEIILLEKSMAGTYSQIYIQIVIGVKHSFINENPDISQNKIILFSSQYLSAFFSTLKLFLKYPKGILKLFQNDFVQHTKQSSYFIFLLLISCYIIKSKEAINNKYFSMMIIMVIVIIIKYILFPVIWDRHLIAMYDAMAISFIMIIVQSLNINLCFNNKNIYDEKN